MHPGYQRNADPFEGSPLYHPIFSEPDPFQLPRFADGRLADFGRASQWLIRSVSRKAAPLTSPPSHAAWTKAHRRHEKQHQHKQSQHNDNQPSAPAATHVRAFVHSSQWGSLAFDTPVASHLNYVNSFPPVSALLQSSQAHLRYAGRAQHALAFATQLPTFPFTHSLTHSFTHSLTHMSTLAP